MNTMKPRIRVRYGVWSCVTRDPFVCGCGYTPADAYEEWRRLMRERATASHPLADEEMA